MEARPRAQAQRAPRRSGKPRNRGARRTAIRCGPRTVTDCSGSRATIGIDLVVVGPEAPLVAGVADELRARRHRGVRPERGRGADRGIEVVRKEVMEAAGVPTAAALPVARPPCVVKADGLAAGKGVFVCRTQVELERGCARRAALGGQIVIEELLEGARSRSSRSATATPRSPSPAAQDYKRGGDGDEGPNTGGMGAYSPVPGSDDRGGRGSSTRSTGPSLESSPARHAVRRLPVRRADADRRRPEACSSSTAGSAIPRRSRSSRSRGRPARRALGGGPRRALGPHASGSRRLGGHRRARRGRLSGGTATRAPRSTGSRTAEAAGALVFHAGTALRDGRVVTNGGRILGVTGVAPTLAEARRRAYAGADLISFAEMRVPQRHRPGGRACLIPSSGSWSARSPTASG